jgi:DNA-binding MarR family transcriptional regulator
MYIHDIIASTIKTRQARKQLSKILATASLIYGEFEILYLLSNDQPQQPSKIGAKLCCEPAAVSRLIKSLSQKALITYEHDDDDRRQIFVRLTKDGNSAIKSILAQSCALKQ